MLKGDIVGMFTGRMCLSLMERTSTNQASRAQKTRKIRRDSGFQKYRRGTSDGLVRGSKFETREHLESLLNSEISEAHEEERQWSLDHRSKGPTTVKLN
jgi:hypothetical protein